AVVPEPGMDIQSGQGGCLGPSAWVALFVVERLFIGHMNDLLTIDAEPDAERLGNRVEPLIENRKIGRADVRPEPQFLLSHAGNGRDVADPFEESVGGDLAETHIVPANRQEHQIDVPLALSCRTRPELDLLHGRLGAARRKYFHGPLSRLSYCLADQVRQLLELRSDLRGFLPRGIPVLAS